MAPLARVRTLPWLVLLDLARLTKAHLDDHLSDKDRKRVAAIAKRTKGDVRKLTEKEKADLKRIGRELNIALLARNVLPTAGRMRRGKGKRR
jgi:hypothetical protein